MPKTTIVLLCTGVDDGGPCREYLRLLMSEMSKQGHLFTGPTTCKVPMHNALALTKGDFYKIGTLLSCPSHKEAQGQRGLRVVL